MKSQIIFTLFIKQRENHLRKTTQEPESPSSTISTPDHQTIPAPYHHPNTIIQESSKKSYKNHHQHHHHQHQRWAQRLYLPSHPHKAFFPVWPTLHRCMIPRSNVWRQHSVKLNVFCCFSGRFGARDRRFPSNWPLLSHEILHLNVEREGGTTC